MKLGLHRRRPTGSSTYAPAASRALAALGLVALLLSISLAVAACGVAPDSVTTITGTPADSSASSTTTVTTSATGSGDLGSSATVTIRDAGDSTTSTVPYSLPALENGITPDQVLQLVAIKSSVSPGDWEIRNCENLGDWAVANLYTSRLSEQMDERGVSAVFEKRGKAWFFAGWVSDSDPPNREVELTNMGAPPEVWRHFGLEADVAATGLLFPPEEMPADFGFIAAFGFSGQNVMDTFKGIFTKDLGLNREPAATGLTLPPEALESLYRDLVWIQNQWQVFSTAFAPDPDPSNTGTSMFVQPYMTYRLEWEAGGFSSLPIIWEDSHLSTDPKAIAVREWFEKLRRLIEATPEWQALPPLEGGYA
jgi:hypothetical protein